MSDEELNRILELVKKKLDNHYAEEYYIKQSKHDIMTMVAYIRRLKDDCRILQEELRKR
jgi:hypothetical protein